MQSEALEEVWFEWIKQQYQGEQKNMELKEIGRMIAVSREKKNISREELCRGVCSVSTLLRLENGERRPDILIFNALCQRLGKSTDAVGVVLTIDEFEYFVKRQEVKKELLQQNFAQAESALLQMEKEEKDCLRKQDRLRLYAVWLLLQKRLEEAEKCLYRAILTTVPDFTETMPEFRKNVLTRVWLSETETTLMLLYAYVLGEQNKKCMHLLQGLTDYITDKVSDDVAKSKRIAEIMYLKAQIQAGNKEWKECFNACETTIEAEVKTGSLIFLPGALKLEMRCFEEKVQDEKEELRRKQYAVLREIGKQYAEDIWDEKLLFLLFYGDKQECHLTNEMIIYARMRNSLSQEQLSEGICTPETLSRIETGKRNPTIKNFHALMEKSGLNMGYYNTEFEIQRFETLEKIEELRHLSILRRYEEAEGTLEEIEKEIDMGTIKNQQSVEVHRIVIEWRLRRINAITALQRSEKALNLTLNVPYGKVEMSYQLTTMEISILNQMAVIYRSMGRQGKAVEILLQLYTYYHNSKLEGVMLGNKFFMVLGNLASYMEEMNELDKAREIAEESIRAAVVCGVGIRIGRNLGTKGYIESREKKKICLNTYEQAYYMCGLYEDYRNQKILKECMIQFGRDSSMPEYIS